MKKTKFVQLLKAERERHGHSQKETGELINMTQTAYCRMEKGRTKISVERSLEIIKLLEKHGYSGIPSIEIEEIDGVPSVSFRWPWNKYLLYALIVVVIVMAIDYVVNAPFDIARGQADAESGKPAPDPTWAVFLAIAGVIVIYGLYRGIKRWQQ